jgi:hypothetical protein
VLPGAGDLGDGGQRERDHGCTSHGSGASPGGTSRGLEFGIRHFF